MLKMRHFTGARLMSTLRKLGGKERSEVYRNLQAAEWTIPQTEEDRDAISKTFVFDDFNAAWAFMSRTALLAETMTHHPEWFNVYNTVKVTLSTHDVQGLSQNDVNMALKMEEYAKDLMK